MNSVNCTNFHSYANNLAMQNTNKMCFKSYTENPAQEDKIELSSHQNLEPPKINTVRLAFNYLSDEQIDQINKSRKLPDNAKFVMSGYGRFAICNNFFGLRAGTQTLPEGFEVKRNVFGFAVVLPKDSEGLMLR